MNVAELFVNLGIKGADKTVGALTDVKKGLNETKSMAWETKAALVAAMYALEKMFAASGKQGTSLTNLNTLLDVSTKTLQEYQYAGQQVGATAEEVAASLKGIKDAMAEISAGGSAPRGLAPMMDAFAKLTGHNIKETPEELMKEPQKVIQYLEQAYPKMLQLYGKGLTNSFIKSLVGSENMVVGVEKNIFRPDIFKQAPKYSDSDLKQLTLADRAWRNLGTTIEFAFGKFNAKHGLQLVQDIAKITDAVLRLVQALVLVGEKYKVFDGLSKIMNFFASILESKPGTSLGETHLEKKLFDFFMTKKGETKYPGLNNIKPIWNQGNPVAPETAAPNMPPTMGGSKTQHNNTTINNHFQHDGKEHQKTGDSMKKAIKDAYYSSAAQGWFA